MRGTELERLLFVGRDDDSGSGKTKILSALRTFYTTSVVPVLHASASAQAANTKTTSVNHGATLHGFLHAFSLVSSRAFIVDAYHGYAMVPVADIFNHVQENHVHLESDFDVCPICGAIDTCPHDDTDTPMPPTQTTPISASSTLTTPFSTPPPPFPETFEMITNAPVPPNTEIFNTYGEHLTNAALLSSYGFALDVNENDVVTISVESVVSAEGVDGEMDPESRGEILGVWEGLMGEWNSSSDDSQKTALRLLISRRSLVCISDTSGSHPELRRGLYIDAEGRVSFGLWVLCVLVAQDGAEEDIAC